jgi:hypothetical protein
LPLDERVFDTRVVGEVEANLAQGAGWLPYEVIHARLRLRWQVLKVLDAWVHPAWPEGTYRKPVIERRYRLRVRGPLPGYPGQRGVFIMVATAYGDRASWWIKPGDRPELTG